MRKPLMSDQTKRLLLLGLALLCIIVMAVQVWRWQKPHYKNMQLTGFDSNDAKLGYQGYVVTSKNEHLYLVNSRDASINEVFIRSNWVDCLLEDNVIVYSNMDKQTGICHFDPTDASIISNFLIINDNEQRIDPSIVKLDDKYYLSTTLVQGTVNRADYNEANGTYTIQLYESSDLTNWTYVTDVYSADQNVEDVELNADGDILRMIFEVETIDKGPSSIQMMESNSKGVYWSDPIVLIANGADNEPASFCESDDEFWLFYSSDITNPGSSYTGSQAYLARYNSEFELINITQIYAEAENQILLYQAIVENGTATILYARDYLGTDDLCLENKGFLQIQRRE